MAQSRSSLPSNAINQILVITPARSASKGIADKNVKLPGGKPLLQWSVDAFGVAGLPVWTIWLQPTSPLRSAAILRETWSKAAELPADVVIGCKEIHRDLSTLFRCADGFMPPLNKDKPAQATRQQIKLLLTTNGATFM